MQNADIAEALGRIADLLEMKGETRFRIQAYQRAAESVGNAATPLAEIWGRGGVKGLMELPAVGEGIARKIGELIQTGKLAYLEELRTSLPRGVEELVQVPHLGPRTALLLAGKLGIESVDELEKALRAHRLRDLPRFGARTEERLLAGLAAWKKGQERMPLGAALPLALGVVDRLRSAVRGARVEYAGSLRRMKETVGDIDILAAPRRPAEAPAVLRAFLSLPEVAQVAAQGPTKVQVRLRSGRQAIDADLRVVEPVAFGAALHYFTGSKAHNIRIREMGVRKGLKINEYGIFRGARRIGGTEEKDVFRAVGLPFIPPELREGAGEVEAAQSGRLPRTLSEDDIRGDLHVHSDWSDGDDPLEGVAAAAKAAGYAYAAVCDHSPAVRIANGLNPARLKARNRAIDAINRGLRGVHLLRGAEVDILRDGSLDYPDSVLDGLDVVVASVHSAFRLPRAEQTARVVRALRNRRVAVLGHPTGRLLGSREGVDIDLEEVIRVAAAEGVCLELNSQPDRLDLADPALRRAREAGARVAINSDAHHTAFMPTARRLGVAMARRGWLEPGDVVNTLALDKLLRRLDRK